nr:YbjN domain-containing protein [Stakelama sediminis]
MRNALVLILAGFPAIASAQQVPVENMAKPSSSWARVAGRNITADPIVIANIVRGEGYKVQAGKQQDGAPFLQSDMQGLPFTIFMNNCIAGKACRTIQFYAGFSVSTPRSLELINRWNQTKRFAKAYIDDQDDPRLEMDLNLADGGIARDNFIADFQLWVRLLAQFRDHIGWNSESDGHSGSDNSD